jgi:hypothetical protein
MLLLLGYFISTDSVCYRKLPLAAAVICGMDPATAVSCCCQVHLCGCHAAGLEFVGEELINVLQGAADQQ